MPTSPRTLIPYPAENSSSWYDQFTQMVNSIDVSLYAGREDRNFIISGGGTMTFSASTGILSWTADIVLFSPITGYLIRLLGPSSVTLLDGELFYITVTRNPTVTQVVTPTVATRVPSAVRGDDQVLVGLRRGSVVHFRDGFVIADGESQNIFDTNIAISWTAGGDLTGTSTSQTVVGLRNIPISAVAPLAGQGLVFDGSVWAPTSIGSVTWATDLTGSTDSSQVVSGLTGSAGRTFIRSTSPNLGWAYDTVAPTLFQDDSLGATQELIIRAQNAGGASNPGGKLSLKGGVQTGASAPGDVGLFNGATEVARATAGTQFNALKLGVGALGGTPPSITRGAGVPAGAEPDGSIYLRIDGTTGGDGLYVREGGAWYALTGSGGAAGGDLGGTYPNPVILSAIGNTTLEKFGAVGDGVTDDHAAYDAALASGSTIWLGSKTYLVAGRTNTLATAGQSLIGSGGRSRLKDFNNEAVIKVGAEETQIHNLYVFATFGGGANNHGVDLQGFSTAIVSGVYVFEPGGAGVRYSTGSVANMGPTIYGVRVYVAAGASGKGFWADQGEYATFALSSVYGGTVGVHNDAGNTKIIGVSAELNTTGILVDNNDSNDGHGIVCASSFNHCVTYAADVKPLTNGYSFNVSHFYYGAIRITGTDGSHLTPSLIAWHDNFIDVTGLSLTNALVEFDGNIWPSANANTITNTGSTIIARPNNMKLDGTPFDFGVNYQWDMASGRALDLKWAGSTLAHFDSSGRLYAGQGTTDSAIALGSVPGFTTTDAAIWGLGSSFQCGTAITASNWLMQTDGANLFISAPHTLGFGFVGILAAGSTYLAKFDGFNSLITFGTGQSNIELTHGQVTAGGASTDALVVIGPRTGAAASASVYLLGNGGVPTSSNYHLLSSGTDLEINAPAGSIFIESSTTPFLRFSIGGGTAVAATGTIRAAKDFSLQARNNANSADIPIASIDGSDNLVYGSTAAANLTLYSSGATYMYGISGATYIGVGSGATIYTNSTVFDFFSNADSILKVHALSAGGQSLTIEAADGVSGNTAGGSIWAKLGTHAGVAEDGAFKLGYATDIYAVTGMLRTSKSWLWNSRNGADSADVRILQLDGANNMYVGDPSALSTITMQAVNNINIVTSASYIAIEAAAEMYQDASFISYRTAAHAEYARLTASSEQFLVGSSSNIQVRLQPYPSNPTVYGSVYILGSATPSAAGNYALLSDGVDLYVNIPTTGHHLYLIDANTTVLTDLTTSGVDPKVPIRLPAGSGSYTSSGDIRVRAASATPVIAGYYSGSEYALLTWGNNSLVIGHNANFDSAINSPASLYLAAQNSVYVTFWPSATHWGFLYNSNTVAELQAYANGIPARISQRTADSSTTTHDFTWAAQDANASATINANKVGGSLALQIGANTSGYSGAFGGVKLFRSGDTVATQGMLRVPKNFDLYARNNANSGDLAVLTVSNDGVYLGDWGSGVYWEQSGTDLSAITTGNLILQADNTVQIAGTIGGVSTIGPVTLSEIDIDIAAADATLTTSQSANIIIRAIGNPGGNRNIILPNTTNAFYIAVNANGSGANVTFKKSGGTGVTVGANKTALIRHNGTDYVRVTADA